MIAHIVDYAVTRYYRLKDKVIWVLWKLNLTETVPASELDLFDLMERADLVEKLG